MAELYWIHLPSHKDVFTQGYVGITKHNSCERYKGHLKDASRGSSLPVHKAIRKYKNQLVVSTLVISELDYILNLENLLRPSTKIGWNIEIGGIQNPTFNRKHSDTSIKLMSNIKSLYWQEDQNYEKRKEYCLKNELPDYSFLNEDGSLNAFWRTRYSRGAKPHLWNGIPILWKLYEIDNTIIAPEILKLTNYYSKSNIIWIRKILRMFRSGWNPMTHEQFLEDFPNCHMN